MMEIKAPLQNHSLNPPEDVTMSDLQFLSQMILADQRKSLTSSNAGMKKKIRRRNSALTSKRDSFLIATKSIEAPGSNFKMTKRNSFLIASEILGSGACNEVFDELFLDDIQEPLLNESSKRLSVSVPGKISKRDSFISSMDQLEYPKLGSMKRRVSQLLLSEFLENDKFSELDAKDSTKVVSSSNEKAFMNLSKEDYAFSRTKPNQVLGIQKKSDRKRKMTTENSFLSFSDLNPFKKASESEELNSNKKMRLFSDINPVSQPKPDLNMSNASACGSDCEKNIDNDNNQMPNSILQNPSNKLVSLCQAMKSSEESQTRIHAWDKKMGLRRSHSKTMRNSMRSRKQLLKFCSNQILMTL